MKRNVAIFTLTLTAFLAFAVWASEPVVCSVAIGTGAATTTSAPTTGACTWAKGATVMLACDQKVYIDSTLGGTATSADQVIDFASNADPYLIHLDNADQHISLLAATTAGTCKFMTTKRRKPF